MCSNHPVGLISSMLLAVTGCRCWLIDPTTYCWRVLTPASFSFISDFISLSSRARRATLVLDKAMSAFNKSGSCFIEEVLVTEDTKKEITLHWPRSLRDTLLWQIRFYVAMMLHHSNSTWESEISTSQTVNSTASYAYQHINIQVRQSWRTLIYCWQWMLSASTWLYLQPMLGEILSGS